MKLKPAILFFIATIIFLFFGILAKDKNLDIQLHDTYFVIDYLHIAIICGVFTGLTSLIYLGFERIKRPVKFKTGFWHFGLYIVGLSLLVVAINLPTPTDYYNINIPYSNYIYVSTAMILIGIILLLTSIIVFLYGLAKTIFSKQQ